MFLLFLFSIVVCWAAGGFNRVLIGVLTEELAPGPGTACALGFMNSCAGCRLSVVSSTGTCVVTASCSGPVFTLQIHHVD